VPGFVFSIVQPSPGDAGGSPISLVRGADSHDCLENRAVYELGGSFNFCGACRKDGRIGDDIAHLDAGTSQRQVVRAGVYRDIALTPSLGYEIVPRNAIADNDVCGRLLGSVVRSGDYCMGPLGRDIEPLQSSLFTPIIECWENYSVFSLLVNANKKSRCRLRSEEDEQGINSGGIELG